MTFRAGQAGRHAVALPALCRNGGVLAHVCGLTSPAVSAFNNLGCVASALASLRLSEISWCAGMVLGKLPCSALLRSRPMLLVPHLFHHSALAVAGKDIACPFQLRTQYHVLNLLLINTCWAGPVKASHSLSMCFGMAL